MVHVEKISNFHFQPREEKVVTPFLFSILLHLSFLSLLFFSLNIKEPPEVIQQVYSVAIVEESAPPPPPSPPVEEKVEQKPEEKKPEPPPPVEEESLNFKKEIKKEEPKPKPKPEPFVYKKKQVVAKKKIKPKKKEVVKKQPTIEDELRELELERKKREKSRVIKAPEKVQFASNTIKIDAPVFPFQWYINAIKLQVDKNWSGYDPSSSSIRQAVVVFVINLQGRVISNTIEKSSNFADFDMAALRAVQDSQFPPLPVGYNEPTLRVHMGFIYEPE